MINAFGKIGEIVKSTLNWKNTFVQTETSNLNEFEETLAKHDADLEKEIQSIVEDVVAEKATQDEASVDVDKFSRDVTAQMQLGIDRVFELAAHVQETFQEKMEQRLSTLDREQYLGAKSANQAIVQQFEQSMSNLALSGETSDEAVSEEAHVVDRELE